MSEDVLRTVLQLFSVVAKVDEVTDKEHEQVKNFLEDHVSLPKVSFYLKQFEQLSTHRPSGQTDEQILGELCTRINAEITQKQKLIVIIELIRIITADASISQREDELVKVVSRAFKIADEETESIEIFLSGKSAAALDNANTLVVDDSANEAFKKAHHLKRSGLKGFVAVLWIQSANLYCLKYSGQADVYMNGVPLKSGNMRILPVGGTVRWGDGNEPVYYGDVLSIFKSFGMTSRISFEGKDISYKFKSGKLGLRNVNLAEESGKLIALMGASGAGKSTLLHVLNGSEKPFSGQVLINGIDIHREPEKIEGIIGFVPQDDLLIEDLTVYQNMYFAAKLCFSDKTEEEIDALVIRVLEDLGLDSTKDLKVGSPLQKTISGGQRKRLNIGLELLREPAVLFCDEPTSGLSSRDSENIIDLLC